MSQLFRLPGAVKRDPSIAASLRLCPAELGAMARHWFEIMRQCGPDVREILHDGHPTACVADAAFAQQIRTAGADARSLLLTITQDPANDQDNDFLRDVLRERLQAQIGSYESYAPVTQAELAENRVLTAMTEERLAAVRRFESAELQPIEDRLRSLKLQPLQTLTKMPNDD